MRTPAVPERYWEATRTIIHEFNLLTREEWFELARGCRRGFNANPLWQLQQRIRDNPTTFPLKLLGMFGDGLQYVREIPWPQYWPIVKQGHNTQRGHPHGYWGFFRRVDLWKQTEPAIDRINSLELEYGPEDPRTLAACRYLIRICAAK